MSLAKFKEQFLLDNHGDNQTMLARIEKIAEKLHGKETVEVVTDNRTLTYEDTEKTFLVATDAKVITLPATKAGIKYTFINTGANGGNIIAVSPAAADGIAGTVTLAAAVAVLDGTVNKDALNTKATAIKGDSLTIVGTGVAGTTAWIIVASTGIWARE
jgi:hypothetical protein